MKTIHRTYVRGICLYTGESLEEAIRTWDSATYRLEKSVSGGVTIQTFDGDLMVRDGWVLHVLEDGTCYLNPRIMLQ